MTMPLAEISAITVCGSGWRIPRLIDEVTPMLNALTFDIEDYFQVSALASAIDRADWETMPRRVVRNTQLLMGMLAEQNTRSTFFFLGWVADRHPELVRFALEAGHEVACH